MKTSGPTVPHILLVDDSKDGLLVRRTLLEEVGYSVQVAKNGEEGLKLFESCKFDLVVTDFSMPRMNGLELIGRIRALNPLMGTVLLSRFVEPLGMNEANTGADAVIAKNSSEPANLLRAVKRLLNRTARKPPGSQKAPRKAPQTRVAGQ
jgi:CheY-like chemotaxis protein